MNHDEEERTLCKQQRVPRSISCLQKESKQIAKNAGEPHPKVPDYIGECFLKIATHLSYRPNFVNYMFKDDMICDGIENCLQYIDNFDQQSLLILLLTSLRSSITLSFVGFKKKRNSWISRPNC